MNNRIASVLAFLALLAWPHAGALAQEAPEGGLSLERYQEFLKLAEAAEGEDATEARKTLAEKTAQHYAELASALKSEQVIQRALAARILGLQVGNEFALRDLISRAGEEKDEQVMLHLVRGLARHRNALGGEALLKVASSAHPGSVRGEAVLALGLLKDERATPTLLDILENETDAGLRLSAAKALAHLQDKKSLERLAKLLENEKAFHVRLALAEAIRKIREAEQAGAGAPPIAHSAQEHENILTSLAEAMEEVRAKLRVDRHDESVQTDQQQIDEQLTQLIKKIEQMQAQSSSSSSNQRQQQQQQQQQQQSQGQGQGQGKPGSPNSPLNDSVVGGHAPRGALRKAEVESMHELWAKLPPEARANIMSDFSKDLPASWANRIKAYFISLAEEEAKQP